MKTSISFEINTDLLPSYTDEYVAALWHIAQANPADIDDPAAGELAEHVAREIVCRFLAKQRPSLWNHQGCHYFSRLLSENGKWTGPDRKTWVPNPPQATEGGDAA